MSLDMVVVASSNLEMCPAKTLFSGTSIASKVVHQNSAQDCLRYMKTQPVDTSIAVVVDSAIRDVSSLNLVDALRIARPQTHLVIVLDKGDKDTIEHAMLAGARSAVYATCTQEDLETAISKVVHAHASTDTQHSLVQRGGERSRGLPNTRISVISARGGVGKSTISAGFAYVVGTLQKQVMLLDGDLQFGDLGFMFDKTRPISISEFLNIPSMKPSAISMLSYRLGENLSLLRCTPGPEQAELVAYSMGAIIDSLADSHELVVINTGGFWTLYQVSILEHSDAILCVLDQSVAGIHATQALLNCLAKLKIPAARCIGVVNKFEKKGLSLNEISAALGAMTVVAVPHGREDFSALIDTGALHAAMEENNEVFESISRVVERVSSITDLQINDASLLSHRIDQVGWFRRMFE